VFPRCIENTALRQREAVVRHIRVI